MHSTSSMNSFRIRFGDVCPQFCLDEISKGPLEFATEPYELTVELGSRFFTPGTLSQLAQLLNQPLNKGPTATNTKWDLVMFWSFRFPRPEGTHFLTDNSGYYSQDDILIFSSALARRSLRLGLCESPDIVECLSNIAYHDLPELHVRQIRSPLDCAGLGRLVQKCVSLKDLSILFNTLEGVHLLGEGLAKASHLQSVAFEGCDILRPSRAELPDVLVSDCVIRQLLGPQSGLQRLILKDVDLKDHHFLRIVEMLPASHLQVLHVNDNYIRSEGIFAFADQLPRIKFLKEIDLSCNPWTSNEGECLDALFDGLLENYYLESLKMRKWRHRMFTFCTSANRARRMISETADSIPKGVWPLILEMMGTRKWVPDESADSIVFPNYRANALYSVLQENCYILLFNRSTAG